MHHKMVILQFWIGLRILVFEFKYNGWAINYASENGHIAILDWFKNSEFEFKYDEWAINYASENGHIAILDWFKNSGFK